MIFLLGFAFLSGLVTILAPCIWPLLPIVLSSSATGGKRKPLGVTLGICLSFAVFTLSLSYLVRIWHFDPNFLRLFAVAVIGFLGLALIIPALSARLEGLVSKLSGRLSVVNYQRSGFFGGLATGFFLGIVWSPCAGPILATIATLAATAAVNLSVVLVTAVYVTGVGIPLFMFAYAGNRLFSGVRGLSWYTGRIQQGFGVIMIITALLIFTNYDKVLQVKLLEAFPSYGDFLVKLETTTTVKKELDALKGKRNVREEMLGKPMSVVRGDVLPNLGPAAEFVGITKWLNTDRPISIRDLKGKVVLVDFWTYTCINCIRTLPHVISWYEKYKGQGFVVIGVHTPEFEFEKDTNNVSGAVRMFGVKYPVAQDNNYATWNAYGNQYWPAKYLIDGQGNVRYTHFGEGEYEQTEKNIQLLLAEAGGQTPGTIVTMPDETPKMRVSPETYLGSRRMEFLYPGGSVGNGTKSFTLADNLTVNSFSLGGEWTIADEKVVAGKGAVLNYNFYANKVFLVLRPGAVGAKAVVKVYLDGKLVDNARTGKDVSGGQVTVESDRLYNLIDLRGGERSHILRLEFQDQGVEVFAFTFG